MEKRKVIQKKVAIKTVVEKFQPLDQSSFIGQLAIIMPCLGLFNYWCPTLIDIAKVSGPTQQMWGLYIALVAVNSIGLWYVSRLFLRRVRDISGNETGWIGRMLIRFGLMSPLLGVQLLLLTTLAPGGDRDRLSWGKRYGLLLSCLVVGHFLYLAWQVKGGYLTRARVVESVPGKAQGGLPSENGLASFLWLRPQLPSYGLEKQDIALQEAVDVASVPTRWRKNFDWATVHLSPYLNPGLKILATSGRDYLRLRALFGLTEDPAGSVCQQTVGTYLGVKVEDCYLRAYRSLNKATPFVTPMMALYFDGQRRSAKQTQARAAARAMSSQHTNQTATQTANQDANQTANQTLNQAGSQTADVAHVPLGSDGVRNQLTEGLLRVENMIEILEPDHPRRTIRHVAAPNGLIFFFGNIEVPFMELVREIQTLILNRRLGQAIAEQLPLIRDHIEKAQGVMNGSETQTLLAKVKELKLRVDQLPKVDIQLAHLLSTILESSESEKSIGAVSPSDNQAQQPIITESSSVAAAPKTQDAPTSSAGRPEEVTTVSAPSNHP